MEKISYVLYTGKWNSMNIVTKRIGRRVTEDEENKRSILSRFSGIINVRTYSHARLFE